MIGRRFSHYRIREKLGEGGMGVVYRAEDLRLERSVALKFLPPGLAADPEAKDRFVREARAASALDHPGICTIYEIDEDEEMGLFIAMADYRGETLKQRIARGPLDVDQAVRIACQVAEALAKAHREGIVHRDVKPSNIFLTEDGGTKVLDFGLAKMLGASSLVQSRTSVGTPSYMAPEHVDGRASFQSDVFSLGVVLYEMLSGRRPFVGEDHLSIFYSIANDRPPPVQKLRSEVGHELGRVVERSLAKKPADRQASMDELAGQLRHLLGTTEPTLPSLSRPGLRRAWWRRPAPLWLAGLVVAGALTAVFLPRLERPAVRRTGLPTAVAVLPFSFGGDPGYAYLGEGMVDLLAAKLDGAGELRTVDSRALLGDLARRAPAATDPAWAEDPDRASGVAERFDAGQFVLGNVVEIAGQLRLDATLYRLAPGGPRELAKASSEGRAEEIFSLVDQLASQLVAFQLSGPGTNLARLEGVTTNSYAALKAYLEGESAFRRGQLTEAAEAFRRAVSEDPEFALAWLRLSLVGEWLVDLDLAREASREADRHADRLVGRHRLFLEARQASQQGRVAEAESIYRRILDRYPEDVDALYLLGETSFHCGPLSGRSLVASRGVWQRLLAIEPDSQGALIHLARVAAYRKDSAELKTLADRMLEVMTESERLIEVHVYRALLEDGQGPEEIVRQFLRERRVSNTWWFFAGYLLNSTPRDFERVESRVRLLFEPGRSERERAFGHRSLAVLRAARGRFREADEELGRAAALAATYRDELAPLLLTLPFRTGDEASWAALREDLAAEAVPTADEDPPTDWANQPHLAMGEHLRLYQLGLLDALLGQDPPVERLEALPDPPGVAGLGAELALGVRADTAWRRRRPLEALETLERIPPACSNYQLGFFTPLVSQVRERYLRAEALRALGRPREAFGWYESLPETGFFDLVYLAPSLLRRGELRATLGEKDDARRYLQQFLDLWQGADEEAAPLLEEARRLLAEL